VAVALGTLGLALPLRGAALLDVAAFAIAALAVAGGTGLLAGAALGDPAWTDPRRMLGPGGRTVTTLALLLEAAVWLWISHGQAGAPLPASKLFALVLLGTGGAMLPIAMAARILDRPAAGFQ
jgi:hypothetical protein